MAKKETTTISERTYTIPLRKEYQKAPRWKRTSKAIIALRQFLQHHMKSKDVRLGKELNQEIWKHGIQNPPHHVKVTTSKDDKGIVTANLFGTKTTEESKKAKTPKK